jgi:hypothetical protein
MSMMHRRDPWLVLCCLHSELVVALLLLLLLLLLKQFGVLQQLQSGLAWRLCNSCACGQNFAMYARHCNS